MTEPIVNTYKMDARWPFDEQYQQMVKMAQDFEKKDPEAPLFLLMRMYCSLLNEAVAQRDARSLEAMELTNKNVLLVQAAYAVKVRAHFIGWPAEEKDELGQPVWAKELNLLERALSPESALPLTDIVLDLVGAARDVVKYERSGRESLKKAVERYDEWCEKK